MEHIKNLVNIENRFLAVCNNFFCLDLGNIGASIEFLIILFFFNTQYHCHFVKTFVKLWLSFMQTSRPQLINDDHGTGLYC